MVSSGVDSNDMRAVCELMMMAASACEHCRFRQEGQPRSHTAHLPASTLFAAEGNNFQPFLPTLPASMPKCFSISITADLFFSIVSCVEQGTPQSAPYTTCSSPTIFSAVYPEPAELLANVVLRQLLRIRNPRLRTQKL